MDWADRVGSRIKLRDLHILLAVVEWKSMAEAARRLAISQPVVSRAIADLEHALGIRLLDRTPRGVEPTVYGRTLLTRGLAVFDELRGSFKDIKFLTDATAGELRIGSTQAIAAGPLVAILEQLLVQRPRLAFQVKVGDAAMLLHHDLRERNVDLLFGRMLDIKEDDLNIEVLFEDPLFVVAGINSRWTRRRKLALKDLVDEAWTMPSPDSNAAALHKDAFRASGLAIPHVAVTSYGTQLQSALIGTGRFLAILPGSYLKFNGERFGLKALPVKLPIPPQPVGVVTLKNRTLSPLTQLFIKYAREVARPLANTKLR
jgi:DNA-binding transcriptional LysR family regulator